MSWGEQNRTMKIISFSPLNKHSARLINFNFICTLTMYFLFVTPHKRNYTLSYICLCPYLSINVFWTLQITQENFLFFLIFRNNLVPMAWLSRPEITSFFSFREILRYGHWLGWYTKTIMLTMLLHCLFVLYSLSVLHLLMYFPSLVLAW